METTSAIPQPTTINPAFVPVSPSTALALDPTASNNGDKKPAQLVPSPTSAEIVAVVGTHILSGVTGSSSIILPNGLTADVSSVATLTGLNNDPTVAVSVGTPVVYIGGTNSSSTYFPNPSIAPIPIGTIASSVIYAAPGATTVRGGS
jgi:hypothetical protein